MKWDYEKQIIVDKVREFHIYYNVPIRFYHDIEVSNMLFRRDLHREEFREWFIAENPVDELDALCDMAYIAAGSMLELGIKCLKRNPDSLVNAQAHVETELSNSEPCEKGIRGSLNVLLVSILVEAEKQHFEFMDAFAEVHRTNMAKGWSDNDLLSISPTEKFLYFKRPPVVIVKRQDGKILKPPSWKKPNLVPFIQPSMLCQKSLKA